MSIWVYNRWPSFSWTEWLWDLIIKKWKIIIPENFKWVKSLEELKINIVKKYSWKTENHIKFYVKWIFSFLNKIKEITWEDPIQYIYFLYYSNENKLSIEQISWRFNSLWIQINPDTLRRYFTKSFWWELTREDRQLSVAKYDKFEHWANNGFKEINEGIAVDIDKKSTKLIELVTDINKWKVFEILDTEIQSIEFKAHKVTYILFHYKLLKEDSKEEFKKFLNNLKFEWSWARKIAKMLNNLINHFNKNIDINISPANITFWLSH